MPYDNPAARQKYGGESKTSGGGDGIKGFLTSKTGALPNWLWLVAGVGGIAAAFIVPKLFGQQAATAASNNAGSSDTGTQNAGSDGSSVPGQGGPTAGAGGPGGYQQPVSDQSGQDLAAILAALAQIQAELAPQQSPIGATPPLAPPQPMPGVPVPAGRMPPIPVGGHKPPVPPVPPVPGGGHKPPIPPVPPVPGGGHKPPIPPVPPVPPVPPRRGFHRGGGPHDAGVPLPGNSGGTLMIGGGEVPSSKLPGGEVPSGEVPSSPVEPGMPGIPGVPVAPAQAPLPPLPPQPVPMPITPYAPEIGVAPRGPHMWPFQGYRE